MKGDRERCLESGMDGYVAKPVRAADLLQAIERVAKPVHAPALDEPALLDRLNGDEHLLRELIEVFEADCPRMQESIKNAIAAGDTSALRIAAHKLKGSVANFSAHEAHAAALRLENLARQQNLRATPGAAAALDKELNRLKRALRDLERRHA